MGVVGGALLWRCSFATFPTLAPRALQDCRRRRQCFALEKVFSLLHKTPVDCLCKVSVQIRSLAINSTSCCCFALRTLSDRENNEFGFGGVVARSSCVCSSSCWLPSSNKRSERKLAAALQRPRAATDPCAEAEQRQRANRQRESSNG